MKIVQDKGGHMGSRIVEMQESQRNAAVEIATKAGCVRLCEGCTVNLLLSASPIESAYRLGNMMFTRGELAGVFSDRREMTDEIKQLIDETQDRCYECEPDDD